MTINIIGKILFEYCEKNCLFSLTAILKRLNIVNKVKTDIN